MAQLPSLRALATLEAVIRTGNIVAAADELCVTPGAVSKQLGHLQQVVDAPLFEKGHRLRPTPLAVELALGIGGGLRQIRDAWEQIVEPNRRVITLAANASLSVHWIIPRLVAIQAVTGGRPVRVNSLHSTDNWKQAQFDIAILRQRWLPEGWRRLDIGLERLTLLAPPHVAATLRSGGPQAATHATFLVAHTRPGELESWSQVATIPRPTDVRHTPHFYLAIEGAAAGHGCIIGPPMVLSALLKQGRLEVPFPDLYTDGAFLNAIYDPHSIDPKIAEDLISALFRDEHAQEMAEA